jgi:hypothetical protein
MTADLLSATADGFFALLAAAIDPADAAVGTNFKEGTEPPLIMLGTVSSDPYDQAIAEQLERVTVEIIVVYRGTDRAQLHRLMQMARSALDRQRPTAEDVAFDVIKFSGQTASGPGEDGVTHAGSIEFEILAQPAD